MMLPFSPNFRPRPLFQTIRSSLLIIIQKVTVNLRKLQNGCIIELNKKKDSYAAISSSSHELQRKVNASRLDTDTPGCPAHV